MIPIRDANPSRGRPVVVYVLVCLNVLFFLFELTQPEGARRLIYDYGTVPALVTQRPWTIFTSMFLHGGVLHLLFNMWFLWIFGDNVEDRLGRPLFVLFYLTCGVVGNLAHSALAADGSIPTIGASGAISGVIGAYIYFYPRARILTIVPLFLFIIPVEMPAFLFVFYWAVLQFVGGMVSLGLKATAGVAYWAHIGGFVAGLLWALVAAPRTTGTQPPRKPPPAFFHVRRYR